MNILKEFSSTADIRTYVYGAEYDSWNRVRTMTYPDGEVVTYHYNAAGQVERLTGNKSGRESVIVDMTGYDEQGHTVYQKLGNGAETTYAYDKQRQRLQEMNLSTAGSQLMQNKYEYDKVDNILSLINSVNPQTLSEQNTAKLGGTSRHTYQYDGLNRLIQANGTAKNASYSMAMTFNTMSMPLTKIQTVDLTETAQSYHNIYSYDDKNHPTAPTQIGNERYEYDANGNPILVTNDSTNTTRELYWDEENRLSILSDNGKTSRYTYNYAGDRIVKSHGDLEGVYINGAPQGITFHEHDDFTLYPASIISINKNRFTKHYFIGSQRIASKLGSGRFNNVYGRNGSYITAGQQDYVERLNQIESQREEYYQELGIPPGVPTMKGAYGEPENTGIGYNTIITELGDHSVPKNWEQFVVKRAPGETPGPPIIWSDPQDPEDAQPGYGFIADDTNEEETFFYHSDHLGSTSYITDDKGNITQYTAYLPYGELLVDEHSSSEELPYKFNGKELDEETGLYYYGARYMQPIASVWYGVDPLMEKYPYVSPYCYTFGNPLKFIDPDGRDGIIVIQENQIIISANVYLYGAGATKDVATQMQKDIDSRWGGVFKAKSSNGKTFDVQVQIKVALYKGKERNDPLIIPESWNPFNRDNFIEIGANGKRSYVLGGDEGVWRSQGRNGKTLAQDNPAPHEIGHILGLDDRYSDKNGRSVPDKGWENNIMGNSKSGKVEQRNIDGILKDAMKAYDKWVQKNNGKIFKYEIDKDNPNN